MKKDSTTYKMRTNIKMITLNSNLYLPEVGTTTGWWVGINSDGKFAGLWVGKLKVIDGKFGAISGSFEGSDDDIELGFTIDGVTVGFFPIGNPNGIRTSVGLTLDKVGISVGASVGIEGSDVLGLKLGLDGLAVGFLLGKPVDGRLVGTIVGAGPKTLQNK